MSLRDNLTQTKRTAHQILDMVRAGMYVHESQVRWALIVLGEPVDD